MSDYHEHEAGGCRGRKALPVLYVVDPKTYEVVEAEVEQINALQLRHQRTLPNVKHHEFCLHPLGITRWSERNGRVRHKQGRTE